MLPVAPAEAKNQKGEQGKWSGRKTAAADFLPPQA